MATALEFPEEGILLSPFIDERSQKVLACGVRWSLMNSRSKVLGIMVKVADPEAEGKINRKGNITYTIPDKAKYRLKRGAKIAREILLEAGVNNEPLITTSHFPRGAHPSCTAAVGKAVDSNLEVYGYDSLFVSDASVIPKATGTPPILTLVALNIRLSDYLRNRV